MPATRRQHPTKPVSPRPARQVQEAPTLQWSGRRAPARVEPARPLLRETFEPQPAIPERVDLTDTTSLAGWNRLYHGDNLPLLHALAEAGERFTLIYADPPYGSGAVWTRKVRLRGPLRDVGRRVLARLPEYGDTLDSSSYLQFMFERLLVMRTLLEESGTLWIHCDHRHAHHLRALCDEVMGANNWLNTITWRSQTARGAKSSAFYFPHSAHVIHVYARNTRAPLIWNSPRRRMVLTEAEAATAFMRDERGFFRTSDPGSYTFESLKRLHGEGRLYAPFGGTVIVDDEAQRILCSHGGNLAVKYYLTDLGKGRHLVERTVDNIWEDSPGLGTTPGEDTGYPTQKTGALLERILATATNPGDSVLDPFAGSGTTLVTAQRMGRRWVGIDAGAGALRIAHNRLLDCVGEQLRATVQTADPTPTIKPPSPAIQPAHTRFALLCAEAPTPQTAPAESALLPSARLLITRNAFDPSRIQVSLSDYRAPAIEALLDGLPVDWHALIDSICIDPAWDGHCFRATIGDAAARRSHTVSGSYEVHLPAATLDAGQPIAVRITNILGEELLLTFDLAAEPAQ